MRRGRGGVAQKGSRVQQSENKHKHGQTSEEFEDEGSKNTADDLFLIVCKTGTSASLILLRVATIVH